MTNKYIKKYVYSPQLSKNGELQLPLKSYLKITRQTKTKIPTIIKFTWPGTQGAKVREVYFDFLPKPERRCQVQGLKKEHKKKQGTKFESKE